MNKSEIQKIAEQFFQIFDKNSKVEVDDKDGFRIKVDSNDSGLLIGKRGETLQAVQYLLRVMIAKKAGVYLPTSVDIGGYKEKHESGIVALATQMAENVKNSGYAQELRPMNAYERRVVHTALAEFSGIKVYSVGDDMARRVRIEAA